MSSDEAKRTNTESVDEAVNTVASELGIPTWRLEFLLMREGLL